MLENYLSDLPQADREYFDQTIKQLPKGEKARLIQILLAMNKNHMIECSIAPTIQSLVEKQILVPCLRVKPDTFTFWIMPDYPYLTTQLGKFLHRHYARK